MQSTRSLPAGDLRSGKLLSTGRVQEVVTKMDTLPRSTKRGIQQAVENKAV
jgi:hypothetical protein